MKIAEIVKWKCFWKLISIPQPFLPLLLSLLAWKVLNTAAFNFEWHTLHNFGDWLTIMAGMAQPWTAITLDRGPSAYHVPWSCWKDHFQRKTEVVDIHSSLWLIVDLLFDHLMKILGPKSLSKSWFKISTKLQPNCSCTN